MCQKAAGSEPVPRKSHCPIRPCPIGPVLKELKKKKEFMRVTQSHLPAAEHPPGLSVPRPSGSGHYGPYSSHGTMLTLCLQQGPPV